MVETQKQFAHLTILCDEKRELARAAAVIGPHYSPVDGSETTAPTTILIDKTGQVRWLFRPDRYLERLSVEELLTQVDRQLRS